MRLAGLTSLERGATDRLLESVVAQLIEEGIRVVGALRSDVRDGNPGHCNCDLWLLPHGPRVRITQDLGNGSAACRMDAGTFEEAVGLVTSRLEAGEADLVVLNKFGLSEAEGRGFRALIAEALSRGMPVLTGVPHAHSEAFEDFAGDMAIQLPADREAILNWCRTALSCRAVSQEEV